MPQEYAQKIAQVGDCYFSVRWNGICEKHFGFDQPRYGMSGGTSREWAHKQAFTYANKIAQEGWTDIKVSVTETTLLCTVAERG